MNWIISANSRMYDHSSSFEHYGSIDWRQGNAKFEVGENYKIDYKNDLVPVCPNCHAMLHRSIEGRERSIEELRKMMKR